MDEVKVLQAFYDGYMEFIGEEADRVDPAKLTFQDLATIAGLRAAQGIPTGTAETVEQGSVHG